MGYLTVKGAAGITLSFEMDVGEITVLIKLYQKPLLTGGIPLIIGFDGETDLFLKVGYRCESTDTQQ